ncbi:hypothetical protein JTE90_020693 [Oedothorax gibbosus]|uniref:BTB domain-containing protein n=1 Tax=Oedothorax gibbosus TaxID=931172 RepID=A0AAV6V721_9ARAC|nr:hypothetical protein JTE90_020693 [Oedothorax gibbosus]
MEFDLTSSYLRHNYQLPSSTISPPTSVDDLKAMYAKSLNADLCLKVKKCVVGVHRALLCACSPVFTKMFEAPMDEKENNVIEITDIELPVVKGLVEFVYTGALCNDDFDFVYDLYYAADKYDVSSLRKTCTDVLLAKLDVENACRVLSLADQHSDVQFKDSIMEFILFNFDDILQTNNWSEFLDEETKLAAEVMRCRSLKSKKLSNNMPVA